MGLRTLFRKYLRIRVIILFLFLVIVLKVVGCDRTPPQVVRTRPEVGETFSFDRKPSKIRVFFSEGVLLTGGSSITVLRGEGKVEGRKTKFTFADTSTAIEFLPDTPFQPGKYLVTIRGFRDGAGNVMVDYTFSFTITQPPKDHKPPQVVNTNPKQGEIFKHDDTIGEISVEFSEKVSLIQNAGFIKMQRGSAKIEGKATHVSPTIAKFIPDVALEPGKYSVVIRGFKDSSGNIMADYAMSFEIMPRVTWSTVGEAMKGLNKKHNEAMKAIRKKFPQR